MTDVKDIKFDYAKFAALLDGSVASNARRLGISRQHLNNIIKGKRVPSGSLLLKIQHVFKTNQESISNTN